MTDLSRGVTTQLASGARAPVWSPDGRRVAFYRSGKIYVKDIDSTTAETLLVDVNGFPRSWSSDDKYLLYETPDRKLFLWPLGGGSGPIAVGTPDRPGRDGQFSSDGRFIAYAAGEPGREEIFVQPMPPASGRTQVSAGGGAQPRWSRTNRELFFLTAPRLVGTVTSRALMAVDVQLGATFSPGAPRKLFDVEFAFGNLSYNVSSDGQRFLVNRLRQSDFPNTPITVVNELVGGIRQAAALAPSRSTLRARNYS